MCWVDADAGEDDGEECGANVVGQRAVQGDYDAVGDGDDGDRNGDEGHAPVEAVGEGGEDDGGDGTGDIGGDSH